MSTVYRDILEVESCHNAIVAFFFDPIDFLDVLRIPHLHRSVFENASISVGNKESQNPRKQKLMRRKSMRGKWKELVSLPSGCPL